MNINFTKVALGLAFTAIAFSASAQKSYTHGVATYSTTTPMGDGESKIYFTADSSLAVTEQGPAVIKVLANSKSTYLAILVDVPVASIKKAAILTPDEIEEGMAAAPKFTFTPTTETKTIAGFACKKVTVKDSKSGSTYTAWITTDITAPVNSLTKSFADAGGFPVQFTTIQQGQTIDVTLKSITDEKAPKGTFGIPSDFEKISLDDLKALGGK